MRPPCETPTTSRRGRRQGAAPEASGSAESSRRTPSTACPRGRWRERLASARAEGRPLRVKLGIDPTAPDIHLGHTVVLRKLREFQDAGHLVVLIIGDYTARVGDPRGRSSLRPMLSDEEIEANARDLPGAGAARSSTTTPTRLEVRRNSEWLDMPMIELLALVRTTTVGAAARARRLRQALGGGEPISVLELLYPLLQGYDSVAVRADVELGGTDQKFNLLLGRDIQRAYGQPEQAILTMPILVGRRRRARRCPSRWATRSASPTRRRRCTARRWRSPTRRWASTTGCCSTASRPPASRRADPRATPSARSRAS